MQHNLKKNRINEQYTNGQANYYSDTVRTAIIKEFSTKKNVRPFEHFERYDLDVNVVSLLKEQVNKQSAELEIKNKQLENKDTQISQMQNLLDQQQRLSLQDKKLLEEYRAENDSLQALQMPSQETESNHLENQYKDEMKSLKEQLETLQEQIKDQKRIKEQENPRKWWGLWRK